MNQSLMDLELSLLRTWCDTLLSLQLTHKDARFDGGILCPSCLHLHGRIIDLLYPLCYLADHDHQPLYREAAERLFLWGENVYCDDHSYYNDAQQSWNKTTIFFAQSLMQALSNHGSVLSEETKSRWEARLKEISEWMMNSFPVDDPANTNYHASCCSALAMSACYFQEPRYMEKAKALKEFCEQFLSEDHFLYGEGNPRSYITKNGCKSIDIGYSMEETLPGLVEYAHLAKDEAFMKQLVIIGRNYLDFLLPDGGMDNSFGTRNFKWTYWGSRTSDGCLTAFTLLAMYDDIFLEACYRNLKQLAACTVQGYLYGGPDYALHGESPCIHHMFAHAKALAGCLDLPVQPYVPQLLPIDTKQLAYYPSLNTYKLCSSQLQTTITAFDYSHFEGGHVSGGVMSLLYHQGYGPVLASGITDKTDREPLNTQLSLKKRDTASSAWRFFYEKQGSTFANVYDLEAVLIQKNGIQASFTFCDIHHQPDEGQLGTIRYTVNESLVEWHFCFTCDQPVQLTLPVIAKTAPIRQADQLIFHGTADLTLSCTIPANDIRPIFSLTPGFLCQQVTYTFEPHTTYVLQWSFAS